MDLPFYNSNEKALEKFRENFSPDIRTAFEDSPNDAISYLRLLGFVCAFCGKDRITTPILKFFHFGAAAKCYDCQKLNHYPPACWWNKN